MAGGAAATCSVAVDYVPKFVEPALVGVLETDAQAIDTAFTTWVTAVRECKAQSPFPTWSTTDGTVCQHGKLAPCKINNNVKGWDKNTDANVNEPGRKVNDEEGYDGVCDVTGKVCWAVLNDAHTPPLFMAALAEMCRGAPGDLNCPKVTTVAVTTVSVTTVPTTTVAVVPLPLSYAGTTTVTAFDSSASSGIGDQSAKSHSASLNEGSLGSLSSAKSSGSLSSGSYDSTASGSSGFYLPIWQWVFILALCCCCLGGLGGVLSGPKKRAVKKKSKRQVAAPAPAPEAAPLMEMPPLMPAPMTTVFLPPIYA